VAVLGGLHALGMTPAQAAPSASCSAVNSGSFNLTNPAFVEFLELRPDSAVLEVGSGLGILAGEVAARAPQGEVIGIEYSREQLAAAHVTRPNLRFKTMRQGNGKTGRHHPTGVLRVCQWRCPFPMGRCKS